MIINTSTYQQQFASFFEPKLDYIEINRNKRGRHEALTKEDFIQKARKKYGNKYDYSKVEYINRNTKILIKCKKHNIEFFQTPVNHLSGWFGCPHCGYKNSKITKGEYLIKEYLDNNDIDYVFQKRFNDCKNQKTLRFDFWLPKHKIIIEYDGKQHYEPINFFGGVYLFEKMQNNDKIKNEYAVRMGYYLLRIKYLEQNNIPLILKNNIRELN